MTSSADIDAKIAGQTIPTRFLEVLPSIADLVALRWKDADDAWHEMTYADFADQVAKAAAGLRGQGLGPGDRLLLMIRNRPEFHVLDAAALFLGATPVSIYNSSSPEQIEYLANDAAASIAVVEDRGFYESVAKAQPMIASLKKVGVIADAGTGADFTYESLLTHEPLDLAEAAKIAKPDDLATLIYTSGTTGPSKGVMIDHRNVCWTVESLVEELAFDEPAGKRLVSYLPMAHIAERMVSYYQSLFLGLEVTCCPDPTLFAAYAGEIHPHRDVWGAPSLGEDLWRYSSCPGRRSRKGKGRCRSG